MSVTTSCASEPLPGRQGTPSAEEIRLFTGAELFYPYKLSLCPTSCDIQWTDTAYPVRDIARATALPAIIRVEAGFLGTDNIDSVSSGQAAVVQDVYKQRRVVAVPCHTSRSYYLSFPTVGYPHKFIACLPEKPGSLKEADHKAAATLDVILRHCTLPAKVRFYEDQLHAEYGFLQLVHIYEEMYLYGHYMAGDGSIFMESMFIPMYLQITLSVAKGITGGNSNDFIILKDAYINQSADLLKGTFTLGYTDMAVFDGPWQTRHQSACAAADAKSSELSKTTRRGDKNDDDDEDDEDDDEHSYVLPTNYIKIAAPCQTQRSGGAEARYVQVEGPSGVIGNRMEAVLDLLERDMLHVAVPPPRPPRSSATIKRTSPHGGQTAVQSGPGDRDITAQAQRLVPPPRTPGHAKQKDCEAHLHRSAKQPNSLGASLSLPRPMPAHRPLPTIPATQTTSTEDDIYECLSDDDAVAPSVPGATQRIFRQLGSLPASAAIFSSSLPEVASTRSLFRKLSSKEKSASKSHGPNTGATSPTYKHAAAACPLSAHNAWSTVQTREERFDTKSVGPTDYENAGARGKTIPATSYSSTSQKHRIFSPEITLPEAPNDELSCGLMSLKPLAPDSHRTMFAQHQQPQVPHILELPASSSQRPHLLVLPLSKATSSNEDSKASETTMPQPNTGVGKEDIKGVSVCQQGAIDNVLLKGQPLSIVTAADVPRDFSQLTNEEICRCLRMYNLNSCADAFEKEGIIDGCLLLDMDAKALQEHFGFTKYDAIKVIKFAREGWRPRLAIE